MLLVVSVIVLFHTGMPIVVTHEVITGKGGGGEMNMVFLTPDPLIQQ